MQDLVSLVSGPKRFIARHRDAGTLSIGRAFAFLACSKLLVWAVPPYGLALLASDLAFIGMALVLHALVLVLAWRIVGGRATLLDYLPIQLYYSAIFSLLILFGNKVWQGVLKLTDVTLYNAVRETAKSGDLLILQRDLSASLPFAISMIACGSILLLWFVAGWGAYRQLNGATRLRSTVAAIIYLGLALPGAGILGLVASALLGEIAPSPTG